MRYTAFIRVILTSAASKNHTQMTPE
jgi:hypothetical protein